MRHFPSDKYTVAWFKLADCISRGEKERALGVHRLLSHSFDDPAFSRQLEGDIHYAFNDHVHALSKYREAAQLYCQQERLFEAAAVCELLVDLEVDKRPSMAMLVDLYRALRNDKRLIVYLQELCLYFLSQGDLAQVEHILDDIAAFASKQVCADVRRKMLYAAFKKDGISVPFLVSQCKILVDDLVQFDDPKVFSSFLVYLEQTHPDCYSQIQTYLGNTK